MFSEINHDEIFLMEPRKLVVAHIEPSFAFLDANCDTDNIVGYDLILEYVKPDELIGKRKVVQLLPPYNTCLDLSGNNTEDPNGRLLEFPVNIAAIGAELRRLLANGAIKSFIVSSNCGSIVPICCEFWRTELAVHVLENNAPATFLYDGRIYSGYALVNESDVNSSICKNLEELAVRANYVPPYIAFALKAVAYLGLSENKKLPKKQIEHWLKENWPTADLGTWSKTKGEYMATFMRHPEDETAGPFREDRSLGPRSKQTLPAVGKQGSDP